MATNRYLKPGLVAALVASLLLAGVAFATPLLQRSRVAVTCVNTGLARNAQSHQFAGPSQRRPCSGPRHKRALSGRIAVTRVPEVSTTVPPLGSDQGNPAVKTTVAAATTAIQPPVETGNPVGEETPPDTTPPQTSLSGRPASMTGSTSATFFLVASESGSSYECSLDGASWASCTTPKSYSGLALGTHPFATR